MDVDMIFKIAAVGIIVAVLNQDKFSDISNAVKYRYLGILAV